jgi:hypothetical protein
MAALRQDIFSDIDITPFDFQSFSADNGIGKFLMGREDKPMKGGLRHIHFLCGIFLRETEEVFQTHGLNFIMSDNYFL